MRNVTALFAAAIVAGFALDAIAFESTDIPDAGAGELVNETTSISGAGKRNTNPPRNHPDMEKAPDVDKTSPSGLGDKNTQK